MVGGATGRRGRSAVAPVGAESRPLFAIVTAPGESGSCDRLTLFDRTDHWRYYSATTIVCCIV